MNEMITDYDFSQAERDELEKSLEALTAERYAAERSYKPALKASRSVASDSSGESELEQKQNLYNVQMQYIQNSRNQNIDEVDSAPVSNEILYNYGK